MYVIRGLLAAALLAVTAAGAGLATARLETTPHGVHDRLLISMGPAGSAGVHLYAGTGDRPVMPGFLDGPVIRRGEGGKWSATWFCEDRVHRASGTSAQLALGCGGRQFVFATDARIKPEASVLPMPGKLLFLSDIEGNIGFLDAALERLHVVDGKGNWAYGANRLVIAGDSVDRGRDVFRVLWRLHGLSQQAQEAGGGVTVLLGNHEQYILRGNISRANREHLYAAEQMGGFAQAFGADTVIGEWLRAQPVVAQFGRVLVTHGGISADVASKKLSPHQMNDAMRRYWRGEAATSAELDSVVGPAGVTQYRGYFQELEGRYAKATAAEVRKVREQFGVDTIVVGHTLVDRVTPLFDGGVYAIDVNTSEAAQQALLFEDGVPKVVESGVGRGLPAEPAARTVRPLQLGDTKEWRMLGQQVRRTWELARLPYPY
jgi:hypothetical protein